MGKYSSRLIGATTPGGEQEISPVIPGSEQESGMFEMFTGAARETPETKGLPEFRETPEAYGTKGTKSLLNTMKMTAGLMFTLDDQSSQDIIKENIPGATFEKDEKGNTIIDIDGEKSVLNKPGWSGQDSVRALTQVLSFVTPAKLAGMTNKLLVKMGMGAAGAGVTEAGIQEIEKMAGSKEERTLGRIVGATVMGGGAEAIGPAYRGVKRIRQAKKLQVAKADIADVAGSVAEARTAEKATGIDLSFPQKTAVPAQLEEMSFVAQLPAGTKKSMQFLRKQNIQASEGVEAYLNALAPPDVVTKGAEKFRTASQLAVGAKKQIRKEAVSPIYKKAFHDKTALNPSDVTDLITSKLDDFPEGGEVAKTLGKIKGLLKVKKGAKVEKPTYKGSHEAPDLEFGATADNLAGDIYPDDIYSSKAVDYYGTGNRQMDMDTVEIFQILEGNPNKTVEIYRAVPTEYKGSKIKEGDWVTINKDYAIDHGESALNGDYSIIKTKAKASEIVTNGDSIHEWGYWPADKPIEEGGTTLKKLHNAKLEIDQMISSYGENSLGNTTKKEVLEIKDALLSYMDEVSPDYKSAREEFARLSPDVTKIQESIIGKMADVTDVQLKTISRRIFDPAETNVQTIRNAKKVIDAVDPEAWNGLLRVEIERRMGAMASSIAEGGLGAVENAPGQLYRAIFKPAKQRNVLMAALDGEQKANLKYLETALKRASLGRPGGSQTAGREEIKKRLRGGVVQSVRNFFKAPVDTLVSTGEDVAFNKRVRDISEVLFSPEYKIKMKKIRKMNPNSSAALKAFTQLLNDAGEE